MTSKQTLIEDCEAPTGTEEDAIDLTTPPVLLYEVGFG